MMVISFNRANELLQYNPDTGLLRWRVRRRGCRHDWFPGSLGQHKFGVYSYHIKIDGKAYYVSRIAWLLMHGEMPLDKIDHCDGNSLNNKFSNLREATSQQNNFNARSHGSLGHKGISFDKQRKKYRARIRIENVMVDLGGYNTAQEAGWAYEFVAAAYQKHFAYHFRIE